MEFRSDLNFECCQANGLTWQQPDTRNDQACPGTYHLLLQGLLLVHPLGVPKPHRATGKICSQPEPDTEHIRTAHP